jgi:hypothetical protein
MKRANDIGNTYQRAALSIRTVMALFGALCLSALLPAKPAIAQSGPYLIHTATAANTIGSTTYIDDPSLNSQGNKILMVTQNWSGLNVYNNRHIAVFYNQFNQRWGIHNLNGAAMPLNATFFVYNSVPLSSAFTHQATNLIIGGGNISGHITYINNPATNGRPEAKLFVTPKLAMVRPSPNNHPIGVWYSTARQQWAIYNQDQQAMPESALFNVFVLSQGGYIVPEPGQFVNFSIFPHTATSANSVANFTLLNTNGVPRNRSWVFITSTYAPNSIYNQHSLGVWHDGAVWSIFNQDLQAMQIGSGYNVWLRWTTPRPLYP